MDLALLLSLCHEETVVLTLPNPSLLLTLGFSVSCPSGQRFGFCDPELAMDPITIDS